jgi:hypothetical protein
MELHANVHAYEYYEPAEDWLPCEDHGVAVYFGDRRPSYIYGGNIKPMRAPACSRSSSSPGRESRRSEREAPKLGDPALRWLFARGAIDRFSTREDIDRLWSAQKAKNVAARHDGDWKSERRRRRTWRRK